MDEKTKKWFILCIVVAAFFMVTTIVLLGGVFTFKFGDAEFSTIDNSKLYPALQKYSKTTIEICSIRFQQILDKQLAYCDLKIDEILALAHDTHIQLLIDKGIQNPMLHQQFRAYKLVIKDAVGITARNDTKRRFINELPRFLKEGEFSYESVKAEYEKYVNNVAGLQLRLVREEVQDNWVDIIVTSEENYLYMGRVVDKMIEKIKDIYIQAMIIQLEYEKIIFEKEKEIYEFMQLLE